MTGRKWTSGPLQDALVGADRWFVIGHIDDPIAAADRAMQRLESGSTRAADAVASAKPDITNTFDRIDRGIASTRDQDGERRKSGLHDGLASARDGMDRIDPTVQQLADVMTAVDEGHGDDFKGQLGRLINSPELADTIEDVTETIAGGVGSFNKFKSWLGFRFEYNVFSQVATRVRHRGDSRAQ